MLNFIKKLGLITTDTKQVLMTVEEHLSRLKNIFNNASADELAELNTTIDTYLASLIATLESAGFGLDYQVNMHEGVDCSLQPGKSYIPPTKGHPFFEEHSELVAEIQKRSVRHSSPQSLAGRLQTGHLQHLAGQRNMLELFHKVYFNFTFGQLGFSLGVREECVHAVYLLRSLMWMLQEVEKVGGHYMRSDVENIDISIANNAYEELEHVERLFTLLVSAALHSRPEQVSGYRRTITNIIGGQKQTSNLLSLAGLKLNSRILSALDGKDVAVLKPDFDLIQMYFTREKSHESILLQLASLRYGLGYIPEYPYSTLVDLVQVLVDSDDVQEAYQKALTYTQNVLNSDTAELILTADKPIARPADVNEWVQGLCASHGIINAEIVELLQSYFAQYDFSQPIIVHQNTLLKIRNVLMQERMAAEN
jgi:hypothetical protein